MKPRLIRWAGHVKRVREKRNANSYGGNTRRKETTRKI
jgi:hypothetical protein